MKHKICAAALALALTGLLSWKAIATNPVLFGDPFTRITAELSDLFFEGKEEFSTVETAEEGLGPVFNDNSCAACHSNPAVGGDSDILETRFGTTTNNHFDPLAQFGGSLIQSQGIGAFGTCNFTGETVPAQATIVAKRKTTPLFGLGLVDHVPDAAFLLLAQLEKNVSPSTAGRPNIVTDLATGKPAVGKFGWKGQNPNLLQFSGDAYVNEMGITNPMFPAENCPNGDCSQMPSCYPNAGLDDDGTDVELFSDFMTLLAAPPRGAITRDVLAGQNVFLRIGCGGCHVPVLITGPSKVKAFNRVAFQPYSDFLLHDMGSLGDGIEQGRATGREMRTAPLWGLRVRATYLHDGRALALDGAILAHDGQGKAAKNRFAALSASDAQKLMAFLNSL
ncbi:MAG TPA: di-heme oxidoredictase family protein [Candidatus Binatia bacterium]|jgi:CxxC motif-containing protein (DUF1111 family)